MAITEGYRVPAALLEAGDRVYAGIGADCLNILEIGPVNLSGYRPAIVTMEHRTIQLGVPAQASYLVATQEEHAEILARQRD